MEILKTKGEANKFFARDVKMSLDSGNLEIDFDGEKIQGKFKRLPKTQKLKRVFYRTCPIYGGRLIPFPTVNIHDRGFLPKKFVGNVLLNSHSIVQSILLKFVLEGERVIPVDEWYAHTKERISLLDELETAEEVGAYFDYDELEDLRMELENVIHENF